MAGTYTPPMASSFGFSFSSEKKESVLTRRAVLSCGSIRDGKKKEDGKMAKKQVSTLLHSHHPLALLFSPEKKEYVHLYAHQKGSNTPGKQHSPLVLPFFLKKECVYLYTRSTPGETCAYMGTEKERQNGRKNR